MISRSTEELRRATTYRTRTDGDKNERFTFSDLQQSFHFWMIKGQGEHCQPDMGIRFLHFIAKILLWNGMNTFTILLKVYFLK